MGHFQHAPAPTRVERWVGRYFTEWVEEAKRLETQRMKNPNQEVTSHPGFGTERDAAREAAWEQFFEHIAFLNDGSPDDQDEPDDEDIVQHDAYDEDEDERG